MVHIRSAAHLAEDHSRWARAGVLAGAVVGGIGVAPPGTTWCGRDLGKIAGFVNSSSVIVLEVVRCRIYRNKQHFAAPMRPHILALAGNSGHADPPSQPF